MHGHIPTAVQMNGSTNEQDKSLVQCNIVVTPKSRKMGLLLPFDIKVKIFKENLLQLQNLL